MVNMVPMGDKDALEGDNAVCMGKMGIMPRRVRIRRFKCHQSVSLSLSRTVAFSSWLRLSIIGSGPNRPL